MQALIEALGQDDLWTCLKAAAALTAQGAVEVLATGLKHPNAQIRWRAAAALGVIGDARAAPPLLAALVDPVYDVRHSVVWALGMIGDQSAYNPLLAVMLDDEDEEIAVMAAFALLSLDAGQTEQTLRAGLNDPTQRLYRTANTALKRLEAL